MDFYGQEKGAKNQKCCLNVSKCTHMERVRKEVALFPTMKTVKD